MPMICTLTRSVVSDGWLSPANSPVSVLGMTREGKVRCRPHVASGPDGQVRDDTVVEVLPEELKFAAVSGLPPR